MTHVSDTCAELIGTLAAGTPLTHEQYRFLFEHSTAEHYQLAAKEARRVCDRHYGRTVFLRGLIEFTNHCACGCRYCGIRAKNTTVRRYRLTDTQILECCQTGYKSGLRTFVLQGGEDAWYTDERLCSLVSKIRAEFPGCAITLSAGERSRQSYQKLKDAGADRYLLRHETADQVHYAYLHPTPQSYRTRMRCLADLKALGYQTGAGMMVGSPGQTPDCLAADMVFLGSFRPHMVGIGPFLPHHATPFAHEPKGSLDLTIFAAALVRLLLPCALIPATTATASASADGRIRALGAGANVIMPNVTPAVGAQYELYDGKLRSGLESAANIAELTAALEQAGYTVPVSRGDFTDTQGGLYV
ncbi:MAG TPA: [FeFe] hydrogenase H-cluster radical SAM maturase HydE [Candidatus Treponema faecavium]|nr:[FeFe] hydrogenase H-cluster radical SAM maturase HydE [Candidatus Treponema faecavium]